MMTWDTFTKAIKDSELDSGTQAQILIKLFKRAGYINKKESDISETNAKKWIFLAHSYNIGLCCHKISNQTSKHFLR